MIGADDIVGSEQPDRAPVPEAREVGEGEVQGRVDHGTVLGLHGDRIDQIYRLTGQHAVHRTPEADKIDLRIALLHGAGTQQGGKKHGSKAQCNMFRRFH